MKKTFSSVSAKAQKYTQKELGFTCIKPIDGEYFVQLRSRSIYVSNMGRVVSTDFQGRGFERELDKIDTGNGYTVNVRRKKFRPNGERLNKIMAEVFLENPYKCKSVRYLDGNYHNCKLENLYYLGKKVKAGKKYPKFDTFECDAWYPVIFGKQEIWASGIVASIKKEKWDMCERLRRLETMHITKVVKTVTGFNATVVDGGGAVSYLSLNYGYFVLNTSWGSCVTVKHVNQPITEESDLVLILNAMTQFYSEFVKTECPMELEDMHIEELSFSGCGDTTVSMVA